MSFYVLVLVPLVLLQGRCDCCDVAEVDLLCEENVTVTRIGWNKSNSTDTIEVEEGESFLVLFNFTYPAVCENELHIKLNEQKVEYCNHSLLLYRAQHSSCPQNNMSHTLYAVQINGKNIPDSGFNISLDYSKSMGENCDSLNVAKLNYNGSITKVTTDSSTTTSTTNSHPSLSTAGTVLVAIGLLTYCLSNRMQLVTSH